MRKYLSSAICVAATVALATPALAHTPGYHAYAYAPPVYAYAPPSDQDARTASAVGAGVIGGTIVGVGVSEGWWGAAATAALPTTTVGAAAIGGVAGMGTVAAIDAFTEPCRGVVALFGFNHDKCVNGNYVDYAPPLRSRARYRYR